MRKARATPTAPSGLCADIGGSFIRFAPVAADGALGPLVRSATPARDWGAFCATLRGCCAGFDPDLPLSIAVAGAIAPASGRVTSANVPCIDGRPLAAALAQALGRPVRVGNDAQCFVLAEALRGAGRGCPVVFGIVLGSGVGGGLVVDGRVVPGAGEWGHGPVLGPLWFGAVEIPPQPCGCGQHGCLDTLGSARGLERLDRALHGAARSSEAVTAAWGAGEAAAQATMGAWLDVVAGPLALVVHATGASVVPVSGGLAGSHALVHALDLAVRGRLLGEPRGPVVVPAQLGGSAGLVGAALRLQPQR